MDPKYYSVQSHLGKVRKENEDTAAGPPRELSPTQQLKGYLFVVADGMGGEIGGKIASHLAVSTFRAAYYNDPNPDVKASLAQAVQAANRAVHQKAQSTPGLGHMGTTLTAAVLRGFELYVGHVGDSRAYLMRPGNSKPEQLTSDHTHVADLVRQRTITPEQALTHSEKHILSRNLGSQMYVQVDTAGPLRLQPGNRLLLCSDGLTGLITDEAIGMVLGSKRKPDQVAQEFIRMANANGGFDNITALVIEIPKNMPMPPVASVQPLPEQSAAGAGMATPGPVGETMTRTRPVAVGETMTRTRPVAVDGRGGGSGAMATGYAGGAGAAGRGLELTQPMSVARSDDVVPMPVAMPNGRSRKPRVRGLNTTLLFAGLAVAVIVTAGVGMKYRATTAEPEGGAVAMGGTPDAEAPSVPAGSETVEVPASPEESPSATATSPAQPAIMTDTPPPEPVRTPTPTRDSVAGSTRPTTSPSPPADGITLTLKSPGNGAVVTGCVPFGWGIQPGVTYDLLVCYSKGCDVIAGIYRGDSTIQWAPAKQLQYRPDLRGQMGVYRWRVVEVAPNGKSSETWEFEWRGGECGPKVPGSKSTPCTDPDKCP